MRFGLFQDVPILLSNLDGLCKAFPSQVVLLPELIHQADEKVRFADPSGVVQCFLKTQGLLVIGESFLIFPLPSGTERQSTTLYDRHGCSVGVGLPEQT